MRGQARAGRLRLARHRPRDRAGVQIGEVHLLVSGDQRLEVEVVAVARAEDAGPPPRRERRDDRRQAPPVLGVERAVPGGVPVVA